MVVNCFQIVSLTYWAQLYAFLPLLGWGCELLSDCIFDLLSTTLHHIFQATSLLWIAFRLYLWPTEHNESGLIKSMSLVVNCFQIVSLTYWAQRNGSIKRSLNSCELLSDCIFDLLSTTTILFRKYFCLLWIAFRLYLWPTEHNLVPAQVAAHRVVNCFQIVSLTYWAQRPYVG